MLRLLSGLFLLALAVPSWAQSIETETPNRDRIVEVHTALNHLTVIEVDEPVVTVATGSSAFKVEWRSNKVFVEPREPNVSTNLFIWTASSRLNYELGPPGPVEKMDFAIDHPKPVVASSAVKPGGRAPESKSSVGDPTDNFSEMNSMLEGQLVRDEQPRSNEHRVSIHLSDLFEQKDILYIRYEIRNDTGEVYVPGTPTVFLLSGVHPSESLIGRENTQLSEREAHKLKVQAWTPLHVLDEKLRSAKLGPGGETVGVIGVKLAGSRSTPQVLRIEFPQDGRGRVRATLVL